MVLSIIIPCHNELEKVKEIVDIIDKISTNLQYKLEVILIDSNSEDGTDKFLTSIANKIYQPILYVPRSYGIAIKEGLRHATGDIIAICPADEQTPVTYIFEALEKYKVNDNIIIKGTRLNRDKFDLFFTKFLEFIIYMFLGSKLDDISTQPKIFTKAFKQKLTNIPEDFIADVYIMHKAYEESLTVHTIEVPFNKKQLRESKLSNTLKKRIGTSINWLKTIINISKESKLEKPIVQLTKFCTIGMLSTITNYVIYLILLKYINYIQASFIAYILAFMVSYNGNCIWTYKTKQSFKSLSKYIIIDTIAYIVQAIILYMLVEFIKMKPQIANIIAIYINGCITYFSLNFYVFKNRRRNIYEHTS